MSCGVTGHDRMAPSIEIGFLILSLFIISECSSTEFRNRLHLSRPWKHQTPLSNNYSYETFYFEQQVDHFGFANDDHFRQRVLIAKQFWNGANGPIFFYTGNEGDIAWFCNNTGFMWDIAAEFKAMLVFAEHRYYGESIPYGPEAYKNPKLMNFLTSEQALADFSVLISHLKASTAGAGNSSVIAFGGSYGGMLAAWMRIKYGNIVQGALAASAPVLQFTDITPCESFNTVLTNAFKQASETCVENIRGSWKTIDYIGATAEGKRFLSENFKLCKPLDKHMTVKDLKSWLTNAWTDLAMVNYPYKANFLEPLPPWPVKAVCQQLDTPAEGKQLMQALAAAVNIYFNSSGDVSCFNLTQQATSDLGDVGWDYQSCTEMVMPMCADGVNDMLEPAPWNFTAFSEHCHKKWKTTPRPYWIQTEYWATHLQNITNIIFSNGLLDPWSSGGVLTSTNLNIVPVVISDGAHHLDLRAANPQDTPSVLSARTQEKNIMKAWLNME